MRKLMRKQQQAPRREPQDAAAAREGDECSSCSSTPALLLASGGGCVNGSFKSDSLASPRSTDGGGESSQLLGRNDASLGGGAGSSSRRTSRKRNLHHAIQGSNGNITRVMLTGGPHGGKSAAIVQLRELLLQRYGAANLAVICVCESATEVVAMAGMTGGGSLESVGGSSFQTAIMRVQLGAEAAAEGLAVDILSEGRAKHVLILFDRGVLDGLAFVEDKEDWYQARTRTGLSLSQRTFRDKRFPPYSLIIHLTSLACHEEGRMYARQSGGHGSTSTSWFGRVAAAFGCPVVSGFNNSPCRRVTRRLQGPLEAAEADRAILEMYESHDAHHVVEPYDVFQLKISDVAGKIEPLLWEAGLPMP